MRTVDYLERVRALTPTGSVYAAAALLGLNENTVRNWSLGKRLPDALACAKIAVVLDMPIEQVITDIELEREKNPERRAYWEGLARKFAACVVMASAITTWPSDARSATELGPRFGEKVKTALDLCINYATWLFRRLTRFLGHSHLETGLPLYL